MWFVYTSQVIILIILIYVGKNFSGFLKRSKLFWQFIFRQKFCKKCVTVLVQIFLKLGWKIFLSNWCIKQQIPRKSDGNLLQIDSNLSKFRKFDPNLHKFVQIFQMRGQVQILTNLCEFVQICYSSLKFVPICICPLA